MRPLVAYLSALGLAFAPSAPQVQARQSRLKIESAARPTSPRAPAPSEALGDHRTASPPNSAQDVPVASAPGQTFTVNTTLDDESNGCPTGLCTLREAISHANEDAKEDAIVFDPAVFGAPRTITLNGTELPAAGGRLTITGPGRDLLTVSAAGLSGLIGNRSGGLTISDLTFAFGRDGSSSVWNGAVMTLNNVTIRDVHAGGTGTVVSNFSGGTMTMNNCRVVASSENASVILTSGRMSVSNSVFESNSDAGADLVFKNYGALTITRSRISDNAGSAVHNASGFGFTGYPAPNSSWADLRVRSSADASVGVGDAATCAAAGQGSAPCTVTVRGTTLEEPPGQRAGGGLNSSLSVGAVTLAAPLADGESVNVQFLLGVQQPGRFRFYVNVEALP